MPPGAQSRSAHGRLRRGARSSQSTGDGARIGATDFDLWLAGQAQGSPAMNEINVIVTGPEEACDNEAEFWCARAD